MNMRNFKLLKSRRKKELSGIGIEGKLRGKAGSVKETEKTYTTTPMVLGWNPLLSTGVGKKKVG